MIWFVFGQRVLVWFLIGQRVLVWFLIGQSVLVWFVIGQCDGLVSDWSVFCVCAAAGVGGSGCQKHAVCLGLEKRKGPGHRHRALGPGNHLHYCLTHVSLGNALPKRSGVRPECTHLF